MRLPGVLCPCFLAVAASVGLTAQAVVSTRSGLVNFSEGTILLDGAPLNQKVGTFQNIKEGSVLRSEAGRAEILLTPGVFLRIDQNSAVRMISSALTDTRLEFLQGAAILDSKDADPGNSVVLSYKSFEVRFPKSGVYRINSEPATFETYSGEAEVSIGGQRPEKIDESRQFFFGIGMATSKYGEGAVDEFSEWARNRAEVISADNNAAAQSLADPADPDNSLPGFTVPVPSYGIPNWGTYGGNVYGGTGLYGSYNSFSSPLYLAGPPTMIYVYPRIYGGGGLGFRTSPLRSRYPVGLPVVTGYPRPGYPLRHTPIPLRSTFTGNPGGRATVAVPHAAGPAVGHAGGMIGHPGGMAGHR